MKTFLLLSKTIATLIVTAAFSSAAFAVDEGRYFLRPVTSASEIEQSVDKKAIADSIAKRVEILCGRFFAPSEAGSAGSVQLHVTYLKKIGGGARILTGPFRGNSHVMLEMTIFGRDGAVLLMRDFHRKNNWITGTVTFGGTDAHVVSAIAGDVCKAVSTDPRLWPKDR